MSTLVIVLIVIVILLLAYILFNQNQKIGGRETFNKLNAFAKKVTVHKVTVHESSGTPVPNSYKSTVSLKAIGSTALENYKVENFVYTPGDPLHHGTVDIVSDQTGAQNPIGSHEIEITIPYSGTPKTIHKIFFIHKYAGGPPYPHEDEYLEDPRP